MTKKFKMRIALLITSMAIASVGGYIIGDWKIVAGIFLLLWANSISQYNK